MTFNTTKSKVPYICFASVPGSQSSVRYALRPTLFELQTILIQVHQISTKWPWILQGQMHPYVDHCLQVPNFSPLYSTTSRFELYAIWDKCTNDSKWPWTLQDQRYTIYVLLLFLFAYYMYFDIKVVENWKSRKCTEWPQTDVEHVTIKVPCVHCVSTYPRGRILVHFAITPAIFEIQGCRKSEMHRMTSEWL